MTKAVPDAPGYRPLIGELEPSRRMRQSNIHAQINHSQPMAGN
jgi:hypothetical protein